MGAAAKTPPFVCFKWPWGPSLNASPSPSPGPNPCGDLELPWWRKRRPGPATTREVDRGDTEQRALAAALASGRAATVLECYSPRCRLCASLQGLVRELEGGTDGSASFVLADAEDDRWLPEFGYIVLTTSAGIMDHDEARRKNVSGKVLIFFY